MMVTVIIRTEEKRWRREKVHGNNGASTEYGGTGLGWWLGVGLGLDKLWFRLGSPLSLEQSIVTFSLILRIHPHQGPIVQVIHLS
jgi:hypothetical protein